MSASPATAVAPISTRVMNLAHFVTQSARRHPERVAFVHGSLVLNWRQLDQRIDAMAEAEAPAFDSDLAQETRLIAAGALPDRPVDRSHMVMLGGSMQPYVWTINGAVWGQHRPVTAQSGERIVLSFHNMSMMGHPMHLHGHVFQVVGLNGRAVRGALRDTVYVPPMSMVDIALDAGEAARWMLHCHHMPHLETGMMTEFAVNA